MVIPQSLRNEKLRLAHEGHQGIVKMKTRQRSKVWWPKMDGDGERICERCHGFQVVGDFCEPEPMLRVEPPSGGSYLVQHLLSPLFSVENLLVIVDSYSSRHYEVNHDAKDNRSTDTDMRYTRLP